MNTAERLITLNRIRKLSRLMDTAIRIPGIGFRFGLDPIIGLIPGAGDVVSTAFSAYIIFLATRFGLPRQVLTQMIFNIALEVDVAAFCCTQVSVSCKDWRQIASPMCEFWGKAAALSKEAHAPNY